MLVWRWSTVHDIGPVPDRHRFGILCLLGIVLLCCSAFVGGGPRVVVSTAALHARVRGSVPGLGRLKETKLFLPHPRVKVSIVGSLRDREVACFPGVYTRLKLVPCWFEVGPPFVTLDQQRTNYVHLLAVDILTI